MVVAKLNRAVFPLSMRTSGSASQEHGKFVELRLKRYKKPIFLHAKHLLVQRVSVTATNLHEDMAN